jgi:hypothetical protein
MDLRRHGLICSLLGFVGCGDDSGTDDDGTAQTSAATQTTTGATSSGSETSMTGTTLSTSTTDAETTDAQTTESGTTSADSTTGDIDVPCGDALTCTSGDVCIEDAFDPECTNLEDPEGMCPDGQTMTQCGGAGLPCCCLPPPASEFRCVTPTGCDGPTTCECLGEVCTDGRECTSLGADPEHLFRCESPPKP